MPIPLHDYGSAKVIEITRKDGTRAELVVVGPDEMPLRVAELQWAAWHMVRIQYRDYPPDDYRALSIKNDLDAIEENATPTMITYCAQQVDAKWDWWDNRRRGSGGA